MHACVYVRVFGFFGVKMCEMDDWKSARIRIRYCFRCGVSLYACMYCIYRFEYTSILYESYADNKCERRNSIRLKAVESIVTAMTLAFLLLCAQIFFGVFCSSKDFLLHKFNSFLRVNNITSIFTYVFFDSYFFSLSE